MKKYLFAILTLLILSTLSSCYVLHSSNSNDGLSKTYPPADIIEQKSNKWYTLENNIIFKFKNAEIYMSTPVSDGSGYLVTYYPICKNCHENGIMDMKGVTATTSVTQTYNCKETTYIKFKIQY